VSTSVKWHLSLGEPSPLPQPLDLGLSLRSGEATSRRMRRLGSLRGPLSLQRDFGKPCRHSGNQAALGVRAVTRTGLDRLHVDSARSRDSAGSLQRVTSRRASRLAVDLWKAENGRGCVKTRIRRALALRRDGSPQGSALTYGIPGALPISTASRRALFSIAGK
jgi:hypothetical protein